MTSDRKRSAAPIRMLFELDRVDNPRLYDDLVQFNKGTKRVNRLRLLAHEGLIAECSMSTPQTDHGASNVKPPIHPAGIGNQQARTMVVQAFEVPARANID